MFGAVFIIWKREILRAVRSKSRIFGSLGMPFFFLVLLGFGIGPNFEMNGIEYMDFITPGITGMILLFTSVFSGLLVVMDRQFGFLKEILVAPVSREEIVAGKILGSSTIALLQGAIMLFLASFVGADIPLASLPLAFFVMFLVSAFFITLGLSIASMLENMEGFHVIVNFVVFPIFFLSGALFPLENLPEIVRGATYLDPLTYGVDALRGVLYGEGVMHFSIELDLAVLFGFLALGVLVSSRLFGRIE